MRAIISKKSLIGGIVFLLLLLLAGNASSEVEPIYAGWTVGDSWDDGSGTSYGTILRSTDSGKTWVRQGEGQIAKVNMFGVFAVDPYTAWVVGDPDSGYATIYHTTNGGTTWERKGSLGDVPNVTLAKVHVRGDDVWAVGSGVIILHSSDGGATWTNHFPAGLEDIDLLQGVYVVDSNTVWVTGGFFAGGPSAILKTTDAGQTWTRQSYVFPPEDSSATPPIYPPPNYFLGISAADADTAWAVGNRYTILKTTNGGATWKKPNWPYDGNPDDLNEVYAVGSTVWVAGDYGIYWTHDGGKSWGELSTGEIAFMGISAVSADEAWASHYFSYGGIYHTTDGGDSWTEVKQLNGKDLPGLINISFATQPITNYLIISLIEDVKMLVDDGLLNKGQGNALIVKLEQVLERLVDDRLKAAINALEAFSNQVDAFVRGGVLSLEDGEDLSGQVNNIIELL